MKHNYLLDAGNRLTHDTVVRLPAPSGLLLRQEQKLLLKSSREGVRHELETKTNTSRRIPRTDTYFYSDQLKWTDSDRITLVRFSYRVYRPVS